MTADPSATEQVAEVLRAHRPRPDRNGSDGTPALGCSCGASTCDADLFLLHVAEALAAAGLLAEQEAPDHCDCTELCAMGPTCPGGWHLPDAGCWRTKPAPDTTHPQPDRPGTESKEQD